MTSEDQLRFEVQRATRQLPPSAGRDHSARTPNTPFSPRSSVAAARIGRGVGLFILGGVLLALGVFGLLAGADGSQGAAAFGGLVSAIGAGAVAYGLWISLFGRLEARLIDIEVVLRSVLDRGQSQADERPTKACPHCAETVLSAAVKCKHCGSQI